MFPDTQNLCFVWFCERAGQAPIKRACPKGVRVPSWWDGGELNMCYIVNIEKHGGEPTCSRCGVNDPAPEFGQFLENSGSMVTTLHALVCTQVNL